MGEMRNIMMKMMTIMAAEINKEMQIMKNVLKEKTEAVESK